MMPPQLSCVAVVFGRPHYIDHILTDLGHQVTTYSRFILRRCRPSRIVKYYPAHCLLVLIYRHRHWFCVAGHFSPELKFKFLQLILFSK